MNVFRFPLPRGLPCLLYCLVISSTLDWLPIYSAAGIAVKFSHLLFFWGAIYLLFAKRGIVKFDFIVGIIAVSYSIKLLLYFISLVWSDDIQLGFGNVLRDFFYFSNFIVFYLVFSEISPHRLYPIIIRGGIFSMIVFFAVSIFAHLLNGSDPFGIAIDTLSRGDFLLFKRDYFYKVLVFLGNSGDEGFLTGKITHSIGTAFLFLGFAGYIYRFSMTGEGNEALRLMAAVLVSFGVFCVLWSYSSRVQLSLLIFIFCLSFTGSRKYWVMYFVIFSCLFSLIVIVFREFFASFVLDLLDNPRSVDFAFIMTQIQDGLPFGYGIGTPMRDASLPYEFPHNVFLADLYVVGFLGVVSSLFFVSALSILAFLYFGAILKKDREGVGHGILGLYSVLVLLFLSQITSLGQFDTAIWLLFALGLSLSREVIIKGGK
jgi:hypothetical protein